MNKSNLDKYYDIESMMEEFEELKAPYLEALEERYEYMKELRREYSNLSHTMGRIQQQLEKASDGLEVDEDVRIVTNQAIERIDEHIEALEEDNQYGDNKGSISRLKHARGQLEGNIDAESIETVWRLLKAMRIEVEEVDVLMELAETTGSGGQDIAQSIVNDIERVRSEYTGSFVMYRQALEDGEDVKQEIENIIARLEDAGYSKEADTLTGAKPDISEERGIRPNPQPLLDILKPIKSAGLEYFQSGNKQSESYDLNHEVAKKVAYARRALLENREYVGTESAFDSLETAYSDLDAYMKDRFYQLNGTPKNYHGHDDRKK